MTTITVAIFLHFAFSLRWGYSLLLSSAWGGVNTTTVVAVGRHLRIRGETITTLTISSLIDDIIVLVAALTILNYMTGEVTGFDISLVLIGNICVSIFLGAIIGLAWLNILYLSRKGEYTFTFTLAAMFLLYSLTEMLSGTGAIAVFLFGLILGNSESLCGSLMSNVDVDELSRLKEAIMKLHSELTFIVVTFFFTCIGLIYVFTSVFDVFLGLVISLLLHGTRYVAVRLGTWRSPLASDLPTVGLIVGKGAASATMSTLPLAYGLPNTKIFSSIALNVILFTNIISIILPFLVSRIHGKS